MTSQLKRHPIKSIFGLGILIRLVLMPFMAHPDLLLSYGRSYEIAFNGANLLRFNQPLINLLQAVWLKLIGVFTGASYFLPLQPSLGDMKNPELMLQFVGENAAANVNIFLFKLLYLIIDIVIFYILYKFFVQKKLWSLGFYWLNPISIFAVYVFGRYEVMTALVFLLAVWLLKRKNLLASALMFGMLISVRQSLALVLIPFWIVFGKGWQQKLQMMFMSLLPLTIETLLKPATAAANQLKWIGGGQHSSYLFDSFVQINDVLEVKIYLFAFVYGLITYWVWQKFRDTNNLENLLVASVLALFAYFATSFFHPHYLAWLVMPLTLLFITVKVTRKHLLIFVAAITIAIPLILLSWGPDMLMGLLIPLNTELGSKDLAGVISNFINPRVIANLGWTLVSLATVITGFKLFKHYE